MRRRWVGVVALIMLVVAACGDDDSTESDRPNIEDTATPTPLVIDNTDTEGAPTPTAVPAALEPAPLTYTVKQGDLLGDIARTFGVPLGAVTSVNSMENPDVINIGQEIIIPNEEQVAEWEAQQAAAETPAETGTEDGDATDS